MQAKKSPNNIFLKRNAISDHGPCKNRSEHEKAVDSHIPDAVDIANQKLKEAINDRPELLESPSERNRLLSLYFLEAMDDLTYKAGLRVLPRTSEAREVLFRKFDGVCG